MIYSKKLQTYIPVSVDKKEYNLQDFGKFTKYTITDGRIPIGYVDLKDTRHGVFVEMIESYYPDSYSGIGETADQIEVEHCIKRGIKEKDISVKSNAALKSHALHYKRGKRFSMITDLQKRRKLIGMFGTADANKIVEQVIKTTKAGEKYITEFLGSIPMYMPKDMIQKIMENIKKNPLLK